MLPYFEVLQMISILIVLISVLLDGILSNFLPYMVDHLSLFTPLFTVMSFFLIYPFFKKKDRKNYFILLFITGIIYDLAYTNLLFYNAILFLISGEVVHLLYKYLDVNFLMILIDAVILVVVYESFNTFSFLIFQVVPISIGSYLYLISHTLLANILFLEIGFLLIKLIPKKYKNLSLN